MKPWILYSLLRVGLFAAVFAVLFGVFAFEGWLAAVIAAAVGLSVSYIFFRPVRDRAIATIGSQRAAEDAELTAEDEQDEPI